MARRPRLRLPLLPLLLPILTLFTRTNSQQCSANSPCAEQDLCCSQYGYCGYTAAYCAKSNNCQSNCWAPPVPQGSLKRATYFPGFAGMNPTLIPSGLFTHVLYAFAVVDATAFTIAPSSPSTEGGPSGVWTKFSSRVHSVKAKAILSLGGGSPGVAQNFSAVASSASRRALFAANAVRVLRAYSFDGLDVDWEFPDNAKDLAYCSAFLTALRSAFNTEKLSTGQQRLLLSAAVSAVPSTIQAAYNISTLNQALDWANLMCYDFHGSWESVTGEHTALYDPSDPGLSCVGGISVWRRGGMAASKILMGLAAYGRTWTLVSAGSHGIGAPASGPGAPGSQTNAPGIFSYGEIVAFVKGGAQSMFDAATSSMYAFKGKQWVGYDNTSTIQMKVLYAEASGLGGYAFWDFGLDQNNALAEAALAA